MYLYFPGDYNLDPYPTANYSSDTNTTLPSLPFMQPHDPLFLDNAIQEYAWFKTQNFTNAQGLIVDGFHISHGQTTCDQRNEMVYSYNQGVILSGLRGLWEATADPAYLADGYDLIATVINATGWNAQDASRASGWAGLGRNGIMEDYCDAAANCSQDAQIFKGIYFHHLDLFCEPLPTVTPLVQGLTNLADSDLAAAHNDHCGSYAAWVTHNARRAQISTWPCRSCLVARMSSTTLRYSTRSLGLVAGVVASTLWAVGVVLVVAVRRLCLIKHYRSVKRRDRAILWKLRGVGWES
jgi:hypothetical protein